MNVDTPSLDMRPGNRTSEKPPLVAPIAPLPLPTVEHKLQFLSSGIHAGVAPAVTIA
jgi:hypothetical protein